LEGLCRPELKTSLKTVLTKLSRKSRDSPPNLSWWFAGTTRYGDYSMACSPMAGFLGRAGCIRLKNVEPPRQCCRSRSNESLRLTRKCLQALLTISRISICLAKWSAIRPHATKTVKTTARFSIDGAGAIGRLKSPFSRSNSSTGRRICIVWGTGVVLGDEAALPDLPKIGDEPYDGPPVRGSPPSVRRVERRRRDDDAGQSETPCPHP
jgi:hypothetical protein